MKISSVGVIGMALLGISLLLGVFAEPIDVTDGINDGGIVDYDQESPSAYQKLISSLKLIDALVQNDIHELELAQHEQQLDSPNSKNGRGFFDQLLNRKGRLLNKRMKSVALGFGK